jgi:hypothetical protein
MTVQFEIAPDANGKLEAADLQLPLPDVGFRTVERAKALVPGAEPAAELRAAAGKPPTAR